MLAVRGGSGEKTNNSLKKFVSKWCSVAHRIKSTHLYLRTLFSAHSRGAFFSFSELENPYLSPTWVTEQILVFLIRYRVMRPWVSCSISPSTQLCQTCTSFTGRKKPMPCYLVPLEEWLQPLFFPPFQTLLVPGHGFPDPTVQWLVGCWEAGEPSRGQHVLWELFRVWGNALPSLFWLENPHKWYVPLEWDGSVFPVPRFLRFNWKYLKSHVG